MTIKNAINTIKILYISSANGNSTNEGPSFLGMYINIMDRVITYNDNLNKLIFSREKKSIIIGIAHNIYTPVEL